MENTETNFSLDVKITDNQEDPIIIKAYTYPDDAASHVRFACYLSGKEIIHITKNSNDEWVRCHPWERLQLADLSEDEIEDAKELYDFDEQGTGQFKSEAARVSSGGDSETIDKIGAAIEDYYM